MTTQLHTRSRLETATPWISTACRLVLAAVLIAAGALKVIDPQSSVAAVRAYELLPGWLERPVGWGLPFLELALGLLLALGLFTRAAAVASGVLLIGFILAVSSAAARGLSIDCGCFGGGGPVAEGQTRYATEILRDLGLLLLCAWLVWRPESRWSVDRAVGEDRS